MRSNHQSLKVRPIYGLYGAFKHIVNSIHSFLRLHTILPHSKHNKSRNVRTAFERRSVHQNFTFHIWEWGHWHQSCVRSMIFAWMWCLVLSCWAMPEISSCSCYGWLGIPHTRTPQVTKLTVVVKGTHDNQGSLRILVQLLSSRNTCRPSYKIPVIVTKFITCQHILVNSPT